MAYQHNRIGAPHWLLAALLLSACRCGTSGSPQLGAERANAPTPAQTQNAATPAGDPWLPGDPGVVDVRLEVRTQLEPRPISPLIYGINYDVTDLQGQRWGVIRAGGGNRSTAYNWENNASNAGSDYLYQNDSLSGTTDDPAAALLNMIDAAAGIGAATIVPLSNADYVAADKNGGGDVRQSGPNYLSTRFKRNHPRKGAPFSAVPDARDSDVYQDELVAFLKAQRPRAKIILSMDNEPDLWSHTHAEIFPTPVTYADLWRRNHAFARAAKDVWPGIEVLGFVSYGYSGFIDLQKAADANGRNFIDWYLTQARAAERAEGSRLIDYLDLHWYPEARGGDQRITGTDISEAVVAAREQAPRSLWDPTYSESSWIRDVHGGPIALLVWLQAKIDRYYPGTKLAFTEWNYGAGNHISGAIAVADVLGIFGKFGVSVATYWELLTPEPFALAAFRAYRNYDGQGSAFGDISVAATSSDPASTTVYASLQSSQTDRTVVIAINKKTVATRAGIQISHATQYSKAAVFVLSGTQPTLRRVTELGAVATNAFRYELPPQSVTVIVPQP